jgi:hypothetical protein
MTSRDVAIDALALNLSPLPPCEDGSKRPVSDVRTENGGWT